jgi:PAS domain S-box-containing protein
MYAIFGLDKERLELKISNLSEALGDEGSERVSQATAELLRTGNPFDITIRTKTPIGYKKWFRVNAFPITEGETIVGVRGICHDITYFKKQKRNFVLPRQNLLRFLSPIRISSLWFVKLTRSFSMSTSGSAMCWATTNRK